MKIEFPDKARVLFDRSPRFITLHGGRGSAKSWSIARALLLRAAEEQHRVLCCREYQNSIAESVHKLLTNQIDDLGLTGFYDPQKNTIIGQNGSEFIFAGLKTNANKVKSYEGISLVWVEEAQTISKASWEILTPTIRLPGSQIICSFNPVLEEDFIYQFFIKDPPRNALVVEMNYKDNPWFGEPLLTEMNEMREKDPDAFLNVWEGYPRRTLDGAVYAKELREATEDGRITRVPYDPTKPVDTFFDLGWADQTCIWFAQTVGFEYRIIDFHTECQQSINHYLAILQSKGYIYGRDFLPHDAQAKQLGSGKSIEEIMRAAGRRVHIVPRLSVEDGINAVRTIFPNCWFDEQKCADGLQSLRRYRYEVDEDTGSFKRKPLHDQHSHASDALRYMAVSLKPKPSVPADRYARRWKPSRARGSAMSA